MLEGNMATRTVNIPVVELDGEAITCTMWEFIQEKLVRPSRDIDPKYWDFAMEHRGRTEDQVMSMPRTSPSSAA